MTNGASSVTAAMAAMVMCSFGPSTSSAKDIIVGTPPWQYKFATDSMLVLPAAVDMSKTQANMRGHALTLDTKRGDFYFEYVVKQADLNNATHNVVKFSQNANGNGTFVGTMLDSDPILAQREPHGIKYELDAADGKEYLYHTNNGWNDSYGEDIGKNGQYHSSVGIRITFVSLFSSFLKICAGSLYPAACGAARVPAAL
jgi:hypothetical protein